MDKDRKERVIDLVCATISTCDCILSGRVYGSWICDESSIDLDIAVVIRSEHGVIEAKHYCLLRTIRKMLCDETNCDIDLVPHTEDEFDDLNSPVWYPRHNPSLIFGRDLKGKFRLTQSSTLDHVFEFADLTAYVLHDNRTICRRQLVRSFNGDEGRIFVSKLLHGPGNALTYHACKNKTNYTCSPSDFGKCFEIFDELFGVNSRSAISFLRSCKAQIDVEKGIRLMNWYENFVNLVLLGDKFKNNYERACAHIGG